MKKIILGFVGDLAAGKGTVAQYLQKKYSCQTYKFSTMLRDVLDRIYVEKTRENLQELSTFLRAEFGQDVMSKVIAKDVEKDPHSIAIVDGVRRPSDISYLKELSGFSLIYITADPVLRHKRLMQRNENQGDDKKTYEQFLKDEQSEADSLISELGKNARFTIVNNGTKEELFEKIEDILKEIHI